MFDPCILIYVPNKDSNQPAHLHSPISLHCPHEEILPPWLSKMCPVKVLIRLKNAQAHQNLHCVHLSKGTFSYVAAHMLGALTLCMLGNFSADDILKYFTIVLQVLHYVSRNLNR